MSRKNKHRCPWLGNQGLWNNSLLDWTHHCWRQREGWEAKCSFCELRRDKMLQYLIEWRGNTHTHTHTHTHTDRNSADLEGDPFIAPYSYVTCTNNNDEVNYLWRTLSMSGRRCCQGYSVVSEFVPFWLTAERWLWCHSTHLKNVPQLDVEKENLHFTSPVVITGLLYQLKHLLMYDAFISYTSIQWKMFILEKHQKVRDGSHSHRIVNSYLSAYAYCKWNCIPLCNVTCLCFSPQVCAYLWNWGYKARFN